MSKPRNQCVRAQRGVSLIELMVALTISFALIGGAIQVYVYSRQNYEVNEGLAQLQETARYALSVLEPDIRMANSWGLVKGSGFVEVDPGLPDSDCGAAFASNVLATLDGSNNSYAIGCPAYGAGPVATADTLIVRRASVQPASALKGRLLICSTRSLGRLVQDSTTCTADPIGQVNDLIVNGYYIDRDSDQGAGLPALRRHSLAGLKAVNEAEIVPGVEDMQIQFGVDPTGTRGIATRYVNPGEVAPGQQVVSVRLWLLVRSERPEQGFRDNATYVYGDRTDAGSTKDLNDAGSATLPYAPDDSFRRLLVSRTIQVRNATGM
jgi:type IV pilus assembly protein PilW